MFIGFDGSVEFRAKVATAPVTKRDKYGKAYWSFAVNDDEYEYPAGYDVSKALNPAIDVIFYKTKPSFDREMIPGAMCYVCGLPDIDKEGAAPFGGTMHLSVFKMKLPSGDWI